MFRHSDSLYGIEADQVRGIFQLPELTLIADAPTDMIGSLNWRGTSLPVMHLDLRLGRPMQLCQLSDSVIVIEWQGIQVGLVVQQVLEVQTIAAIAQEAAPDYGRSQTINTAFVAGIAKIAADLIVLLNLEALIRQPDQVALMIWESALSLDSETADFLEAEAQTNAEAQPNGINFYDRYCGLVTAAERAIFQQRAEELRSSSEEADSTEKMALAVIRIGADYFALELGLVREFINVQQVTPIPCTPQHIVGNINLRGEVMTLVDILPTIEQAPTASTTKAVVVEVDDIVAGIPVDAVLDVMYLSSPEITEMPIATDYFQGTAQYQDQHLRILDLPTLFSMEELVVNQSM